MKIDHLGLQVRDPERSRAFYLDELGFDATTRTEEWGVRVEFADGFMLALIRGEPVSPDVVDRVHLGCLMIDADAVRTLRSQLGARGVEEVEWCDEPGYVSVKVRDPDGYVVELAYDVS